MYQLNVSIWEIIVLYDGTWDCRDFPILVRISWVYHISTITIYIYDNPLGLWCLQFKYSFIIWIFYVIIIWIQWRYSLNLDTMVLLARWPSFSMLNQSRLYQAAFQYLWPQSTIQTFLVPIFLSEACLFYDIESQNPWIVWTRG